MAGDPVDLDLALFPILASGSNWEDLPAGYRFRTSSRSITETDLLSFTRWAGFTDALFTDSGESKAVGYADRIVPAIMTMAVAEGLVIETNILQGTGLAFLKSDLDVLGPVFVGDTVSVAVEVTESRAASSGERGVVTTANIVFNQHGTPVLTYHPVRLMRGRARSSE